MRPGSVTTVARADDMLLFGLSGNPSACYVGFTLFVKPMIQTWLLNEKPHSGWAEAVLTNDFPKPNPFTRFVRAFVYHKDGKMMASLGRSRQIKLSHISCRSKRVYPSAGRNEGV